jgi:hypothetical protein
VVELLVEVGNAQLDKQGHNGRTALHCAAVGNQLVPAKYLVARGCTIDAQSNDVETHLAFATQGSQPQLIQFLTSASLLFTNDDYRGLRFLCAPFSSPFLVRKIALSFRYTTMLCLKTVELRGDAVANCTLLSRIYQHEQVLVRHILSHV